MQSRTKTYMDAQNWKYFFTEEFEYDPKGFAKFLKDGNVKNALKVLSDRFGSLPAFTAPEIEKAIREVEQQHGIAQGKLNQPLRIAVTGTTVGAGVYETAEILGAASCVRRIARTLAQTA